MCGISLSSLRHAFALECALNLPSRGPDCMSCMEVEVSRLRLCGSVLHIQGANLCPQPHVDIYGNILLWNGEVFGTHSELSEHSLLHGIMHHPDSDFHSKEVADTILISKLLCACIEQCNVGECDYSVITNELANIQGPYAFIYYHAKTQQVIFGRDPFGRRSLLAFSITDSESELPPPPIVVKDTADTEGENLKDKDTGEDLAERDAKIFDWRNDLVGLSSVDPGIEAVNTFITANGLSHSSLLCSEIGVEGVYVYSASSIEHLDFQCIQKWPVASPRIERDAEMFASPIEDLTADTASDMFLEAVTGAIRRRVGRFYMMKNQRDFPEDRKEGDTSTTATTGDTRDTARVGVLFSGGVDSVLLAALLFRVLAEEQGTDATASIDLINVSFVGNGTYKTASPDRLAAIASYVQLKHLFPLCKWNLIHVDITSDHRLEHEHRIRNMIQPCDTHMDLNIGTVFWFAARGFGYLRDYSHKDVAKAQSMKESGSLLLRTGTSTAPVQSTEIDTETVVETGTETKRVGTIRCGGEGCRKPAKKKCTRGMCQKCCRLHFKTETSPQAICRIHGENEESASDNTADVADGSSSVPVFDNEEAYEYVTSRCKALLVGIGADEQMAGYGRHRNTYQRGGVVALCEELNMDMQRLWKRNLGRDDRCIGDSGREAWFPYLDEEVVSLLHKMPLCPIIADFSLESGEGDKRILRETAKKVGLSNAADLVKRAVQFGSRIAKHTNQINKQSNRKGKGETKI